LFVVLAVVQELQLKHQAVDAFREMAAVFEEQLRLGETEQKKAASSDIDKYNTLIFCLYFCKTHFNPLTPTVAIWVQL